MRHRVDMLGTWVDNIDDDAMPARLDALIRSGGTHQLVTANVDFLRLGIEHAWFRDLVNGADLVVPDGMPLVWASRLRGQALPCRLTGIDVILACAALAVQHDYGLFLLGAGPQVAAGAADALRARFPGLRIAGTHAPFPVPFSPLQAAATVERVRQSRPDILLVAFGAPDQERWIATYREQLGVPLSIGVGGALDILAGRVGRAPLWMQRSGLEWAYRMIREPRRLWKRYLIHDLPIFFRLMRQSRATRPIPSEPLSLRKGVEHAWGQHADLDGGAREESSIHSA